MRIKRTTTRAVNKKHRKNSHLEKHFRTDAIRAVIFRTNVAEKERFEDRN
jgi:hypothetical protein